MMMIGSQMLPALSVTGPMGMPLVSATVEIEIAARKTGKAQITSRMRERIWSTMPPKKPAIERDDRRDEAAERGRGHGR